ncbi:VLRF1 family aeRF1-type release factor [Geomicrobium sediminis]|uniref:Protein required for attachment to host cells n=1 Tax=Geomicrobium sediminis TaxID=1347788 RepID=A0ABS2PIZ5_9BACL|nr:VLRF1 family aeRF1-type release factor [Geomicrobium sediminis]MBM7634798.1 hypothetical protein [Geomicrobium sediminis]
MSLIEELDQLQQVQDKEGTLTVYLNTDFQDQNHHRGEWKIRLKNGRKRLIEYAEKSEDADSVKKLKKRLEEVESYINDQQANMQRGLVIVTTANGDVFSAHLLQVPVETSFHWEEEAELEQLHELLKSYPQTGIIVTQKTDVTFIDTALGEVRDSFTFSWDFENDDWVQHDEGHASSPNGADTANDEFDRRFEENMQRWYKKLAPVIIQEMKKRELNGAFFVGSKPMIGELTQHFSSNHIQGRVEKNLGSKSVKDIVYTVFKEA